MSPQKFTVAMRPHEFDEALTYLKGLGDFCVLPEFSDHIPFPQYDHPDDIPTTMHDISGQRLQGRDCFLWNRSESIPPRYLEMNKPPPKYRLTYSGSDVIQIRLRFEDAHGLLTVFFEIDDAVLMPDGTYEPRAEKSFDWFAQMKNWFKDRSKYLSADRLFVSYAAFEHAKSLPEPPYWFAEAQKKMGNEKRAKRVDAPSSSRSYQASFEALAEIASLDGEPKPRARRCPRYGDENPGPTLFRTSVDDAELVRLTLPGLYIDRSELRQVSWTGSDLHRSTFNWSDFTDCDFSGCNLAGNDLRACNFARCRFVGADLSRSDLRGSSFEDCDFTDAKVKDALLNPNQRDSIKMSDEQRDSIIWSEEYQEPEGA